MNLRRTLLSVTATLALLSACSLRPSYRDVVVPEGSALTKPAEGQKVVLRLVNPASDAPLAGVRVLAVGSRSRLSATTDEQGLLTVQISRALLEENPLVEVVLPKGVKRYRFEPVVDESGPGDNVAAPAGASAMAADGGTGTDAGM